MVSALIAEIDNAIEVGELVGHHIARYLVDIHTSDGDGCSFAVIGNRFVFAQRGIECVIDLLIGRIGAAARALSACAIVVFVVA